MTDQPFDEVQERWISCHLYYHEDPDRVVRGVVHPVVISLVKADQIEAFFFVRYALGGPHVRLRLRARPGFRDHVLAEVQRLARDFFDLTPSTKSLAEEVIQRSNEYILAGDPHEIDTSIYPDNSLQVVPFRPEVERYGGPGLFRSSLDVFTLSSVAAIELLAKHGDASRSVLLAQAFLLLLQQALGFAADEAELLDLLRYGVDSWSEGASKVVEKADRVAVSQRELFLRLFRESLARVRSVQAENEPPASAAELLAAGSGRLSEAKGTGDRVARARTGGSHLHMTASRLGLSNAEELYLSRLLTVTLQEVLSRGEEDLSWIGERGPRGFSEEPAEALRALLPPALSAFVELPPKRGEAPSA
ncbi:MAG TPA: lantibiotic dehydratase C-terminal domain-containing protein [Thermoanaerobaculia bacterium]|nr:lantibiotic dehydratase C-terminal domain-containing protein [Thermoanaerobaculia bacterium]